LHCSGILERVRWFCKIDVDKSCVIREEKGMIYCFVLHNGSFNNWILLKGPNTVVSRYLIVRKVEPSLSSLSFGEYHIIVSLKIVRNEIGFGWVDNRIDVVHCEIEVGLSFKQSIDFLLRSARTFMAWGVATR
jgi:hypothetical protein